MPLRDSRLIALAKEARRELTEPESRLWYNLRAHRFYGVKFTNQTVIEPYRVDFAARRRKLVIELDGDTHAFQQAYDQRRTAFLEAQGYRVLRFTNGQVMNEMHGVLERIATALDIQLI